MAQIPDRSGNSRHFLQSDSAKRPTLTTQSNVDCWSFDGSNDRFEVAYNAWGASFPYTFVGKFYDTKGIGLASSWISKGNSNSVNAVIDAYMITGQLFVFANLTGGNPQIATGVTDYRNQWVKAVICVTSSSLYANLNGNVTSVGHSNTPNSNALDFMLAGRSDGLAGLCKVAYAAIFNRELTSGEISALP